MFSSQKKRQLGKECRLRKTASKQDMEDGRGRRDPGKERLGDPAILVSSGLGRPE
ncbi:hypothetical protein ACRRTK_007797 [Alexandromys fortis]